MNVIPADQFTHDVFLSHSSRDKAVARTVAERLGKDGLRAWLDDWEIRSGDMDLTCSAIQRQSENIRQKG